MEAEGTRRTQTSVDTLTGTWIQNDILSLYMVLDTDWHKEFINSHLTENTSAHTVLQRTNPRYYKGQILGLFLHPTT